jgi:hypothetical protein
MVDAQRRQEFELGFALLLVRFGADEADLRDDVARTVDESLRASSASTDDGSSLSALDVLRIRAGKFAAARLPAALYRDAARLFELRREIKRLCDDLLEAQQKQGSRF